MRLDGSDVVVTGMIYGLTAGMAAGTSLAFLAVERGKILIRVLVTAVLCGSAAFFLEQIHAERYVIPGVILLWFAILSLAVSAQNGRVWSDAVICFFLCFDNIHLIYLRLLLVLKLVCLGNFLRLRLYMVLLGLR